MEVRIEWRLGLNGSQDWIEVRIEWRLGLNGG